jgi:hypothetical protein
VCRHSRLPVVCGGGRRDPEPKRQRRDGCSNRSCCSSRTGEEMSSTHVSPPRRFFDLA